MKTNTTNAVEAIVVENNAVVAEATAKKTTKKTKKSEKPEATPENFTDVENAVEDAIKQSTTIATAATAEADKLAAEAAALMAKAKEAQKAAKEAAQKAKMLNAHPVKLATYVLTHMELTAEAKDNKICGEELYKTDVHYYAEKRACDLAGSVREAGDLSHKYCIYKVTKETGKALLVGQVTIDPSTMQIVIA